MNDPNIVVVIHREGEDQDDEDSKLDGIWWTYKWCIEQWRLNPEFLSGDATYNVDDFGMPLFQLNGITSIHSTFNVYWELIGNESAEMFTWVLQTVRSVAIDYKIALPSVIVSDYNMDWKRRADITKELYQEYIAAHPSEAEDSDDEYSEEEDSGRDELAPSSPPSAQPARAVPSAARGRGGRGRAGPRATSRGPSRGK